jgi:aminoglycoside phosphotransferase (APT) family kinase protein
MAEKVPNLVPPLTFSFIAGGRSNLTYAVTDAAGHRWALRRPPTGAVLATAHDMTREWRLITAVHPAGIPVADPVALCTDETVTGAPFYVMSFVDGVVLTDRTAAQALDESARGAASRRLVDVLAELHALRPDEVGLDELAGRTNYVGRQLRRWKRQVHSIDLPNIADFDAVHDMLAANVPEAERCIVHGDYRAGNVSFTSQGDVAAVFDWELATLGDPLSDLGWLIGTWERPGDDYPPLTAGPSAEPGFAEREALIARYAAKSGRDVSNLGYYVAFNRWRAACIGAGVLSRYRAGVMGVADEAGAERELLVAEQLQAAKTSLGAS